MKRRLLRGLAGAFAAIAMRVTAAAFTPGYSGDCVITNFQFTSGQSLPELRMHYITFGHPRQNTRGETVNAVLILHGTTGQQRAIFGFSVFAGELYGAGQPLDTNRYYLIIPDNIGHGKSSKPSDGLRAHFPEYGYRDMIEAQYRLLTEGLKVNHLRLVIGTSMGGMHSWLWGEIHPDFMDALMPLASLPTQVSGRNRVWRRGVIDAITNSPDWDHGDYQIEPAALRTAEEMLWLMGENPVMRAKEAPTLKAADDAIDRSVARSQGADANDILYAVASSRDYDPGPDLEKIKVPLVAINSADDLINPPELRVLEREIKRVKHGKAVVLAYTDQTVGHGSHTKAVLWKKYLVRLLRKTAKSEN